VPKFVIMERIKKITNQLSADDVKRLDLNELRTRYGTPKEDAVVIDGVNVSFVMALAVLHLIFYFSMWLSCAQTCRKQFGFGVKF